MNYIWITNFLTSLNVSKLFICYYGGDKGNGFILNNYVFFLILDGSSSKVEQHFIEIVVKISSCTDEEYLMKCWGDFG
jgi:hypothetical protein